ncbi:hypothetical protein [Sphingopyxis sp. Root1497]|nr:hypothetical protein [Sphingopyxis sp. Root1497]
MFQNNDIFPSLGGLSLAGKPIRFDDTSRRSPMRSRHQIKALIARIIG